MFGAPATQGASFYLVGSDVFIKGNDQKTYRVDKKELIEVDTVISADQITKMSFDTILKKIESEPKDALDKK